MVFAEYIIAGPEQHADRVQVVGSASHNVAGSRALIVRVGKAFEMTEEVVAQIEFDFAGDADHDPAGQKLKDSFARSHRQQEQRIGDELVPSDTEMKVIHRPADYLRKKNPDAVCQEDAYRPQQIAAAILSEVGNQGTQAFRQHRRVR